MAAEVLELLRQVGQARGLGALGEAVLRFAMAQVPKAQAASLLLLQESSGQYEFVATVGWDLEKLKTVSFPKEKLVQHRVYGDKPAIIKDILALNRAAFGADLAEKLAELGPVAVTLTLPLWAEGTLLGYLNLDHHTDPQAFCEEDLRKLSAHQDIFAGLLRLAWEREELRESEKLFRLLFERLADAVYITAFDGTILEANPAAEGQTGYSRKELLGMNIMRDIAAGEPAITYETAKDKLRRGETVVFEEKKRRKDGTFYWTECGVTQFEYKGHLATLSVNRDITARVETEEALRRVNAALTALSSTLELPELLRFICREAHGLIPFDAFFVAAVDRGKGKIVPLLAIEEGEELRLPELPLDPKTSPTAWVAVHKEALFLEDTKRTPPPVPCKQVGKPTRAWVGIPLLAQNEVVGVLSVQGFSPMRFGERERDVLLALASGAATALRNSLLHAQVRSTAEKLRQIEEASRQMKLAQSPGELYAIVLEVINKVLGFKYAAILEPREEALVLVAHRGYPPELLGLRLPLAEGKGITLAAFLADAPVYVPDVRKDPRYVAGLPTISCEVAIPISVGDRKLGVLNVEHDEPGGISAEDQELLKILAAELGVALLGLLRQQALENLSQKLAILHEVSQSLQRCTTAEEVCAVAVKAAAERLGFEPVVLGLGEGEIVRPVAWAGKLAGKPRSFRKGEGIAGMSWASGRTLWANAADEPIKSVLSVPLGEKGVLQVFSTKSSAFSADDVAVVEILGRHVYEELRRVELEAELREQAIRDPLTKLYNRRFLAEVLTRELARAERYGHPLAILILDVDNFKELNDRFGHMEGDRVLVRAAEFLRNNVRRADYVFRWGGDEFVVVLPETDEKGIKKLAERLDQPTLEMLAFPAVRFSFGYAVWDPKKGEMPNIEELFRVADAILCQMKREKKA